MLSPENQFSGKCYFHWCSFIATDNLPAANFFWIEIFLTFLSRISCLPEDYRFFFSIFFLVLKIIARAENQYQPCPFLCKQEDHKCLRNGVCEEDMTDSQMYSSRSVTRHSRCWWVFSFRVSCTGKLMIRKSFTATPFKSTRQGVHLTVVQKTAGFAFPVDNF